MLASQESFPQEVQHIEPNAKTLHNVQKLIDQYRNTQFHHQLIHKTFFDSYCNGKPILDSTSNTKDMPDPFENHFHPAMAENEVAYFKKLLSYLKFKYLEQDTKEKFLKQVLMDVPIIMDSDEVNAAGKEIMIHKRSLKSKKDAMDHLKAVTLDITTELCTASEKVAQEVDLAENLLADIENLKLNLAEVKAMMESHDRTQILNTEKELYEQIVNTNNSKQELASLLQECRNLTSELNELEREVELLTGENDDGQTQARSASLAAASKDANVQLLCSWYKEILDLYRKLLGIQKVEAVSPTEFVANYKVSEFEVTIRLTIDPESGKIVGGQVDGLEEEPKSLNYCPTQKLFESLANGSSQNQKFIINEILTRVKACERRKQELSQINSRFPTSILLGAAVSADLESVPLTLSFNLEPATGLKLNLIVEFSVTYPIDLKCGMRRVSIEGNPAEIGKVQLKLIEFSETTEDSRTITNLLDCLQKL